MAEDKDENRLDGEGKSKGGMIIMLVAGVLLLIGISVGATMYFVGFFDPPSPSEEELAAAEQAEPAKMPAMYFPIKPSFIVNFQSRGRQRYLQTDVTVMTRDQLIFNAVQSHLPLIKNRLVMVLSGEAYADLQTHEGRELLRQKAMQAVQDIIKQETGREDGVEQILFTNFVMQ
jgi:flagellar FliL protein